MRLDKLWIKEFKNLRDFDIDFDEEQMTTVLIGHNGTGKSNLIEAIVIIFRDLDLGRPPEFSYNLTYPQAAYQGYGGSYTAKTRNDHLRPCLWYWRVLFSGA